MREGPGSGNPIRGFEPANQTMPELLRPPLLGAINRRWGIRFDKEINLLGDDLAAVTLGAVLVSPAGVMDAALDHDHGALRDVHGNAPSYAVEACDPVSFGLGLAIAFSILEAAIGGKRDGGNCVARLRFAGLGIVTNEVDEGDGVFHEFCLSKLFCLSRKPSP